MRVGFLGAPGSFSEGAAFAALGDAIETVGYSSFDDVFGALERGDVDRSVVPIENSLAGSIHRNYDLLQRHDVHIVAEHDVRIRHLLLARPGTAIEDLEEVLSHPQALAQCEEFLSGLNVRQRATQNTATGARLIRDEELSRSAAIASERAAEIYGLDVLARDIEGDPENYTRFFVLARESVEPPAEVPAKTSIVFSLKDEPSVLFKALSVFALRDIDLTKIESRPMRGHRWKYLFYLDFRANTADERARNALRHLEEIAPFLRVLGCYPSG